MVAKEEISTMERVKSDGEVLLEEEEEEDVMLPGYRFHPTDEELVTFYLRRKVARKALRIEVIREMDIYKHDPWDLPKASTVGGEKEWYFFCLRGRKYRNSVRPNRVTGAGFWKATGIDRPINARGRCIGLKKSLVYYHRGSAGKGTKTEWMMHEFRLPPRPTVAPAHSSPCLQEAEVWTICRIFKRTIAYKRHPQQQVAGRVAASVVPQPESSSVTACSLESVCTGEIDYEYMNCLQTPNQAPAAANNMTNGYNGQNFQGLQHWDSTAVHPVTAQPLPAMASLSVPSSPAENDDYWDDIGRMVLELTDPDPSVFYDCRY